MEAQLAVHQHPFLCGPVVDRYENLGNEDFISSVIVSIVSRDSLESVILVSRASFHRKVTDFVLPVVLNTLTDRLCSTTCFEYAIDRPCSYF